jgi:hypothetical protein
MAVNVSDGFAGKGIGQVFAFFNRLRAAVDRILR